VTIKKIVLTEEEQRMIQLARMLTNPANFSLETELQQMQVARVISISSAYRATLTSTIVLGLSRCTRGENQSK
jgi:hypothetical protein